MHNARCFATLEVTHAVDSVGVVWLLKDLKVEVLKSQTVVYKAGVPVVESRIVEGIAVVKPGRDVVSSVVSCVADETVDCQIVVFGGLADVSSVDSGNDVAQQHCVDCTIYVTCISIAACSFRARRMLCC